MTGQVARSSDTSAPSIELPFPATVRGLGAAGDHFTVDVVLDKLSTDGLYMRLPRPIAVGTTLFVVVRLTARPAQPATGPGIAVRGVVVRSDTWPSGMYGYALVFTRQRFLYATP